MILDRFSEFAATRRRRLGRFTCTNRIFKNLCILIDSSIISSTTTITQIPALLGSFNNTVDVGVEAQDVPLLEYTRV